MRTVGTGEPRTGEPRTGEPRTGELSLIAVDPADEDTIREWYELRCAVVREDLPGEPQPCRRGELARLRHPEPGRNEQVWVARPVGGSPTDAPVVGSALLELPVLDNLDNAGVEILVAPGYRRRGIGRALLTHLCEEALRAGRVRLTAEVNQPLEPAAPDPGGRFAAACGAVRALASTLRRLDLETVDQAALDRLAEQARPKARGYSLAQWVGPTPARWQDDIAYLTGRMLLDAPLDDLRWEAEVYDAARLAGQENSALARGRLPVTTAAVDGAGTAVAFTQIVCPATPAWYAEQWDTIVAPEHRGHRLGTLTKVANLAQVRAHRPELRFVDTENADSNPYMVSINEAIGFRPYRRFGEWQLKLSRC